MMQLYIRYSDYRSNLIGIVSKNGIKRKFILNIFSLLYYDVDIILLYL